MKLYSGTRIVVLAAALVPVSLAYSQQNPADAAKAKTVVPPGTKAPTADGHPIQRTWTFGIDLPHGDLVKVVDGRPPGPRLRVTHQQRAGALRGRALPTS